MSLPAEPAVFLDRDGVLNRAIIRDGKPYPPRDLGEFAITPDARAALFALKSEGFLLVVVTNQPDVVRGRVSRAEVDAINAKLASGFCHSTRSRFASTTTRNFVTAASRSPA
jgi:D-glycero-D-manno-heptose 1,7-bisphosphate phosphatase